MMPPTKQSLLKLFEVLNLKVSPVRVIDCLVYCKDAQKPKVTRRKDKNGKEIIEESQYDTSKLIQWLHLNIRTFEHLDKSKVDEEWKQEVNDHKSVAKDTLMPMAWKPHPKAYIRRHTGTGGSHINRIVKE